jgi:hypothetical protein
VRLKPLSIFDIKEEYHMTEVESQKPECGDAERSMLKELAYSILAPLLTKSTRLELEVTTYAKDPFIAYFELADMVRTSYREWMGSSLGGEHRD